MEGNCTCIGLYVVKCAKTETLKFIELLRNLRLESKVGVYIENSGKQVEKD